MQGGAVGSSCAERSGERSGRRGGGQRAGGSGARAGAAGALRGQVQGEAGGKKEKGRYLRVRPAQTHMKEKKNPKDLTVLLPVSETLIKRTCITLSFYRFSYKEGNF